MHAHFCRWQMRCCKVLKQYGGSLCSSFCKLSMISMISLVSGEGSLSHRCWMVFPTAMKSLYRSNVSNGSGSWKTWYDYSLRHERQATVLYRRSCTSLKKCLRVEVMSCGESPPSLRSTCSFCISKAWHSFWMRGFDPLTRYTPFENRHVY